MGIVAICAALLVGAVVLGVTWAAVPFASPAPDLAPSAAEVARRYAWYVSLALLAGLLAGVAVIGAGGRLAMRLLAVTGGDDAQGRITEAEEVVGQVSAGGTLAFVLFTGIFGGCALALVYVSVRRLLPSGVPGGVLFGLVLLVVLGTRADPLRRDNPDFDIVGPGWLAVLVFSLLAVAFGVALAGVVSRLSRWLPAPALRGGVLARYAVPALLALVSVLVLPVLLAVGLATVLATRWPGVVAAVRSPRVLLVGRIALAAVVLVCLPGTLATLADLASR